MTDTSVSVLIVGAGPTGLVAANLLGLYGVKTLLIERNAGLNDLPRAISIDDEGLRICQALGLREEVLEHVLLDVAAEYLLRGRLLVRVAPSSRRNGYPLISTFEQPCLEATLLIGLQRFPCVEVRFEQTLETFEQTKQGVLASIRTSAGELQQIACTYLLGCDGGRSLVRRTLGIALRGTTFSQRWLVVDAQCEAPAPARHITIFGAPARPAVSVPAPGKGWRWEFMLLPEEHEDWFLSPANIHQLIQQAGDTRDLHIIRQRIYTFHAAHAPTFVSGRVFLLGDAAHLMPPFGGQGMNSGLRDAHNLTWKLALVLNNQANPDLLTTYQQERAPHVAQTIRFATLLGKLAMPIGHLRGLLRDSLLRALLLLTPIASLFTEMRIKPQASYRHGLLHSDGSRLSASFAGKMLPQPVVLAQGHKSILLDELLGPGFALLRLHADPNEAFKPLQADLWQKLQPRCVCIVPASEPPPNTSQNFTYAQDNQHFERFVRGRRDIFLLVRPDRYICGIFHVDRERAFAEELQKRLFS